MRKNFVSKFVLAAAAVAFMTGAAFAEFNLRTSVDTAGDYELEDKNRTWSADADISATISGDYLRSIGRLGQYLKIGGGFEVLIPRYYEHNSAKSDDVFWFLPLYLSIQTNPIQPVPELFFRFNLGVNVLFIDTNWDQSDATETYTGGLYYAFVTGWEFPFGLFFDVTYAFYNGSIEYSRRYYAKDDVSYSRLGIGVGYKFGRPRR